MYYTSPIETMSPYRKLIYYWSRIFDKRNSVNVLDNVNFNATLFQKAINLEDILSVFDIEPGYTSPDASSELDTFARQFESVRLSKNHPEKADLMQKFAVDAGIGFGNGCTCVVNGIINSVLKWNDNKKSFDTKPEIALALPNYTVYTEQATQLAPVVKSTYIHSSSSNNFLPTFDEVFNSISKSTVAIILTYPTNPAQSTFSRHKARELERIVDLCQCNKIFLVADNIYQDLIYDNEQKFVEIFSFSQSLDYLIKVYGHSKDTPFFSGYRTGYWFGDPRIITEYRTHISATENTLNTVSMVTFALSLLFRKLIMQGRCMQECDLWPFDNGILGWNTQWDPKVGFQKMIDRAMFEKYSIAFEASIRTQQEAIEKIKLRIRALDAFSECTNQNIGNVLFIRVRDDLVRGTDHELFEFLILEFKIGVLPGSVFGVNNAGQVWFRITVVHESVSNIINGLETINNALFTESWKLQPIVKS